MKFTEFVSEIIKSVWAWIGLFMDVISGIVYVKPDLIEKFSFLNVVQEYLFAWVALGTFLIIWSAWKVTNKILEEKKNLSTLKTNQHFGNGDIVEGDKFDGDKIYGNKYEDIKVILPDSKKKETLNKLDWHVKQVVNEIVLYKAYSDKEVLAKKKYNEFQDFYQNNSAEVSLVLEKLIKRVSLEMRSVISQVGIFYGMKWIRDSEIASKVPFENLSPLPKVDGIEEELVNLCDRIHEEIYKELKT